MLHITPGLATYILTFTDVIASTVGARKDVYALIVGLICLGHCVRYAPNRLIFDSAAAIEGSLISAKYRCQ